MTIREKRGRRQTRQSPDAFGPNRVTPALVGQAKHERFVAIPVYAAAALAVAGLLMTFKAAPFMLSLRHIGNEEVALLEHAFNGFRLWGGVRTVLQTLAFGANLWSLAAIAKYQ